MSETHIVSVANQKVQEIGFCVLSEVRTTNETPQYRRRVHLSLSAAKRAVERAQQRGLEAHIVLCKLQPVKDGEVL